jgi:hypothetical protein
MIYQHPTTDSRGASVQNSAFRTTHPNAFTKKVVFRETVRVQPISQKSSEMSPNEKSKLYYSKDDMQVFQAESKEVCKEAAKRARSLSVSDASLSTKEHFSSMLESDSRLRGLECHVCPIRKGNRAKVNEAVLACQKELNSFAGVLSPEQRQDVLANAYSSLTSCSQMLAYLVAKSDEIQARQQSGDSEINTRANTGSPTPDDSLSMNPYESIAHKIAHPVSPDQSPIVEKRRSLEAIFDGQTKRRRILE